jgi:putative transposase
VIQHCQIHKKRNVKAHVPEKHHAELKRRLSEAYQETSHETAKTSLEPAGADQPGAAASLREGLEATLTVVRLRLLGALRRTLSTTNSIASALSVTRRVTRRVTNWRDGGMRRWCVAGKAVGGEQVPPGQGPPRTAFADQGPGGDDAGTTAWKCA